MKDCVELLQKEDKRQDVRQEVNWTTWKEKEIVETDLRKGQWNWEEVDRAGTMLEEGICRVG